MSLKDDLLSRILKCKRCGHEWLRRKGVNKEVRQCPNCKSAWWDTSFDEKPKGTWKKENEK